MAERNDRIKLILMTNKTRMVTNAFQKTRTIYEASVESAVDYGISVWRGACDTTIDPLTENTKYDLFLYKLLKPS